MKFNFVAEFRMNEVEGRLILDMIIGWTAFLIGVFWDPIAQKLLIHHADAIGAGQLLWCGFWGLYNIWTSWQFKNWKE